VLGTARFAIAFGFSITLIKRPVLKCQAIWQWKDQTPGLLALTCHTIYPLVGSI
jgi:hypothetical protein